MLYWIQAKEILKEMLLIKKKLFLIGTNPENQFLLKLQ